MSGWEGRGTMRVRNPSEGEGEEREGGEKGGGRRLVGIGGVILLFWGGLGGEIPVLQEPTRRHKSSPMTITNKTSSSAPNFSLFLFFKYLHAEAREKLKIRKEEKERKEKKEKKEKKRKRRKRGKSNSRQKKGSPSGPSANNQSPYPASFEAVLHK